MFEIIILVFVLGWFAKKSRELGRNQLTWALIALASYIAPLLLLGKLILPMVLQRVTGLGGQPVTITVFGIGLGLVGCWFAGKRLVDLGPAATLSDDAHIGTNDDSEAIMQCVQCRWKGSEVELCSKDETPNLFDSCPDCGAPVGDLELK